MADLKYEVAVEIDVASKGGGISGLGSGFDKLGGTLSKFGGRMADVFTGAVEQAGALAMNMAKVGVGLGVAGAAYGVLKLNAGLESTTTSIAAVLTMQKEVGNIGQGMDKAGSLVAKMKQDARELPGEFEDLLGIFQSGMAAAGNAGINSIQFEQMSAKAMVAAKAMAVPMDQAGRELAQLLEGRAGAHNVFGTRLGITAKDGFNQSSKEDQVKRINAALDSVPVSAFAKTFDAISSTFVDNVKQFGTQATGPLFEHIKATLSDINNWFDNNKGQVAQWANQVGRFLTDAFDKGKAVILDWWPAISAFAENAYNRITAIWADVGPTVSKIGDSIKDFLKDPGSIDKIIRVLELYAAVKVGGGAMDLFGGLGGGKGGAGAALSGMGGMGGMAGAAMGAVGSLALTVGAVTIAAQVAQLLGGNSGKEYDMFEGNDWWSTVGNLFVRKAQYAVDEASDTSSTHARLIATYGQMDMASQAYQARIEGLIASGDDLGASLLGAAAAANTAAAAMNAMGGSGVPPPTEPGGEALGTGALNYVGMMAASGVAAKIAGDAAAKAKDPKKGGGGGGGAQKVEITINSNQAPGQIAREVVLEVQRSLADKRRNPGSSLSVRNFSAIRGG